MNFLATSRLKSWHSPYLLPKQAKYVQVFNYHMGSEVRACSVAILDC